MNRRRFLTSLGAAAAAVSLPAPVVAQPFGPWKPLPAPAVPPSTLVLSFAGEWSVAAASVWGAEL